MSGEAKTEIDGGVSLCRKCSGFLCQPFRDEPGGTTTDETACSVCLGLWKGDASLQQAISKACEPYGGMESNRFSMKHPPTVVIPGDVALRYHLAALGHSEAQPLPMFLRQLKAHLKSVALDYVKTRHVGALQGYPSCVESEEQGFLCVHVLATPAPDVTRPPSFVLSGNKKKTRKRFRGHDPTEKQGGDPRQNLQLRLCSQGVELWSCADVEAELEGAIPPVTRETWKRWFRDSASVPNLSIEYHVAVWRRPFFVRGLYTKARRDVSQTPFYVPSEENASVMKRLGVTSVEEQINPVLAKVACGGISDLNNEADGGDTVFSAIKFHASGREDLDVRMLLPPEPTENVGGRPFICQVIDALRMPTMEQVQRVPSVINCTNRANNGDTANGSEELMGRRYGQNPLGVDISDCFTFVPSNAFKNLQGETEDKVKHYGCLCWSKQEISSQEDLLTRLGSFPLPLNQKTPIRVLHRRSNAVRVRRVLTLNAKLVDKHHFRLSLSTDGGTYVKEFVHGDLGRTVPSVSSLLGCKTDILELDCEGIAGV